MMKANNNNVCVEEQCTPPISKRSRVAKYPNNNNDEDSNQSLDAAALALQLLIRSAQARQQQLQVQSQEPTIAPLLASPCGSPLRPNNSQPHSPTGAQTQAKLPVQVIHQINTPNSGLSSKPAPQQNQQKTAKRRLTWAEKLSLYCHRCGRVETPEWRKGPDGPATLCNACGLQWSTNSLMHKRRVRKSTGTRRRTKKAVEPQSQPPVPTTVTLSPPPHHRSIYNIPESSINELLSLSPVHSAPTSTSSSPASSLPPSPAPSPTFHPVLINSSAPHKFFLSPTHRCSQQESSPSPSRTSPLILAESPSIQSLLISTPATPLSPKPHIVSNPSPNTNTNTNPTSTNDRNPLYLPSSCHLEADLFNHPPFRHIPSQCVSVDNNKHESLIGHLRRIMS
ncbi:hypothetical protein Pelo_7245 [Pelomyxa schiedti]|nr:hypothetical protein Pelo_7245 [Pelomyxa schiedti]